MWVGGGCGCRHMRAPSVANLGTSPSCNKRLHLHDWLVMFAPSPNDMRPVGKAGKDVPLCVLGVVGPDAVAECGSSGCFMSRVKHTSSWHCELCKEKIKWSSPIEVLAKVKSCTIANDGLDQVHGVTSVCILCWPRYMRANDWELCEMACCVEWHRQVASLREIPWQVTACESRHAIACVVPNAVIALMPDAQAPAPPHYAGLFQLYERRVADLEARVAALEAA